ncbi:MAG TPA: GGDEF domain-containing protein [Burkholderiales bacterium]|nr:GGDEF domain-containing protein [Burkholderiales bacterium]
MNLSDHGAYVAAGGSPAEALRATLAAFALPVALFAASALAIRYAPELPESLAPLRLYAPYLSLGVGLLISLAFKRGRALFAILSLLVADVAFTAYFGDGLHRAGAAVYGAICLFVPLNLALLALASERGALNVHGARRLAILTLEIGVTAAVVRGGYDWIVDAVYRPLFAVPPLSPIPQACLAVMALSTFVALVAAARRSSVTEAGFGVAIAAFAAACQAAGGPDTYAWLAAAGVILTAAVLQDSYRMAFRDELTGLPGRRALNEGLMGLEGHYTIAMLDIDHFKNFNDTWGHEVGDQALKLVASRLQRVGGGGIAYRYGGEEFTIVFPGTRLPAALGHLERLRRDIERYKFEIRSRKTRRARGQGAQDPEDDPSRWVSVEVSIGAAHRNGRLSTPDAVMSAADQALYRAKQAGRNRVSH